MDRKTDDLLRYAGFQIRGLETGYMRGPKPWTFMYQGVATDSNQNSKTFNRPANKRVGTQRRINKSLLI